MTKIAALALAALFSLGLGAAHAALHQPAAVTTVADGYGWGGVVTPGN
ncbi:hypothetical protein ABT095_13150 [Kitasatospora sp. NPDC002227]